MITEKRLSEALTYLAETDEPCAELKADVERTEYKAKVLKSAVFLHHEGSVAERQALADSDKTVQEAFMEHFASIRSYHAMANKRALEVLVVDVWRSINANRRTGSV